MSSTKESAGNRLGNERWGLKSKWLFLFHISWFHRQSMYCFVIDIASMCFSIFIALLRQCMKYLWITLWTGSLLAYYTLHQKPWVKFVILVVLLYQLSHWKENMKKCRFLNSDTVRIRNFTRVSSTVHIYNHWLFDFAIYFNKGMHGKCMHVFVIFWNKSKLGIIMIFLCFEVHIWSPRFVKL